MAHGQEVPAQPLGPQGAPGADPSQFQTVEGYGTTELGYGTTNADAGVGIGMKRGGFDNLKKTN